MTLGRERLQALEEEEAWDLGGAFDEARFRADRDGDARFAEHRDVEGVVAEGGVERARSELRAEVHDLARTVRDRAHHARRD
ncbi:MAG: hypothetical protein JWO86_3941, partial [Myxococcaceae bacterium]|nr:hypothetical protein [Myxococcaceae bacterium]